MKKIIFILILAIGAGSMAQAQLLKNLKTKAKNAVDNSVDRSTDKVVDKAINKPADNITDTALDKAGKKINTLFKKQNKNNQPDSTGQATVPVTDSIAIKRAVADSIATVVSVPDSTATKPRNRN